MEGCLLRTDLFPSLLKVELVDSELHGGNIEDLMSALPPLDTLFVDNVGGFNDGKPKSLIIEPKAFEHQSKLKTLFLRGVVLLELPLLVTKITGVEKLDLDGLQKPRPTSISCLDKLPLLRILMIPIDLAKLPCFPCFFM